MASKRPLILGCLVGVLAVLLWLFFKSDANQYYQDIADDITEDFHRAEKFAKTQQEFAQRSYHKFYQNGLDLMEENKLEAAIVEFDRAIADYPKHFDSYCRKAECQYDLGRYEEAIATDNLAIKINWSVSAFVIRGRSYEAVGRHQEAIDDYQFIIERWPNEIVAHNNLAWLYAGCFDESLTDETKAVEHAEKVRALSLKYPEAMPAWMVQALLGVAYSRAKNFPLAIQYTEEAIRLAPEDRREQLQKNLDDFRNNQPYHRTALVPPK